MKVLLLNTYPQGGAGNACRRLQSALQESGVEAPLLTQEEVGGKWPFYAERLSFLPYERDKSVRFAYSLANFGHDLSRHPLVREADVLHLHWINQGFLSLPNIHRLATLGKPVVWTLHDMWAFTGGCHYSGDCTRYEASCGQCPYLRRPGPADLSNRVWQRKKALFPENIQFVTCSQWLGDVAARSGLLKNSPVRAIPNPIDTTQFQPAPDAERAAFRQELGVSPTAFLVLFAAMKIGEERKGFKYLLEALQMVRQANQQLPIEILVLGKSNPEELAALPYPVHALGLIHDTSQLARAYGVADLFVIPSLEDNLPNTVMEALACGTPVAGFATGGIPEMVGHLQEGYIAPQHDSAELARGIARMAQETAATPGKMRSAARHKVEQHYANPVVATRYLDLYRELLAASPV